MMQTEKVTDYTHTQLIPNPSSRLQTPRQPISGPGLRSPAALTAGHMRASRPSSRHVHSAGDLGLRQPDQAPQALTSPPLPAPRTLGWPRLNTA